MKVYCVIENYSDEFEYRELYRIFSTEDKARKVAVILNEENSNDLRHWYEVEAWEAE